MDALVRMNADELNESLLDFIQSSFKEKFSKPAEVNEKKPTKVYTLEELKAMFLNESEF